MIYLLLAVPLLFLCVLLFRAVACASPHVRLGSVPQKKAKALPAARNEAQKQLEQASLDQESAAQAPLVKDDDSDASAHSEADAPSDLPEAHEAPEMLESPEIRETNDLSASFLREPIAVLDVQVQERQTLLVCAARYSPDALDSFLAVTYPHLAARMKVHALARCLLLSLDCDAPDAQSVLVCALLSERDATLARLTRNPFFSDAGQCDGQCRAVAVLDALETLLARGVPFKYNVRLLLAASEESLPDAAAALSETDDRYVCTLCEGGRIAPFGRGKHNRIAAVGVGVRAHAHYRLDVCCDTEHADAQSAVQIAARAALRMEKRPFGLFANESTRRFARYALYENGFFSRIIAVDPWLFPLTIRRMTEKYGGADAVRSIVRVREMTCEQDGAHAFAKIDCLLASHMSAEAFEKKLRRRIRDDRIRIKLLQSDAPPAPFDETSVGFRAVQKAVALSFSDTNAAPAVLCRAPQAVALGSLCDHTFAFSPCDASVAKDAQRIFFENFFLQFC